MASKADTKWTRRFLAAGEGGTDDYMSLANIVSYLDLNATETACDLCGAAYYSPGQAMADAVLCAECLEKIVKEWYYGNLVSRQG